MRNGTAYILLGCYMLLIFACATRRAEQARQSPPSAPTSAAVPAPATGGRNTAFSPRQVTFSTALLGRLQVPAGFTVGVYARGVTNARMLATGPNGVVYVSQPELGRITALWDRNDDGQVDAQRAVATGLPGVHGLAVHDRTLYLATVTAVYTAAINTDGTLGTPRVVLQGLPAGGRHPYRTLGIGPDGRLYISVGSPSNDTPSSNLDYAAILQCALDGSGRRVFASGLRNTEAFDWHPASHVMWGMDQGSDNRGPDAPPDELNHLIDARHFGWPWCYGHNVVDAMTAGNPPGMTKAQFCATAEPSTLDYQAHSSPIQLKFYTGSLFPAEYSDDAFITFHGSWNRRPAVGYKVVRLHCTATGQPTSFEDFLTGFLTDNGATQFARPCGLTILPDGSLLVGDDSQGVIYRVGYRKT